MKYNQATLQTHYVIDMHCNLLTNSRSRGIPVTFLCVDSVLCSTAGGDIKLIKINGVNQQDESLSNLTFIYMK